MCDVCRDITLFLNDPRPAQFLNGGKLNQVFSPANQAWTSRWQCRWWPAAPLEGCAVRAAYLGCRKKRRRRGRASQENESTVMSTLTKSFTIMATWVDQGIIYRLTECCHPPSLFHKAIQDIFKLIRFTCYLVFILSLLLKHTTFMSNHLFLLLLIWDGHTFSPQVNCSRVWEKGKRCRDRWLFFNQFQRLWWVQKVWCDGAGRSTSVWAKKNSKVIELFTKLLLIYLT